jgi:ATP-dependent RNA helicase DDX10/DBP4
VATPGRLLQHLEQTPLFDASTLQILVLDEADRILDMGFRPQLERILEYLPSAERQTLLFSATQTRNVKDLARLSLTEPEYVGVHDKEATATPDQLVQSVMVCPLPHKLNMIFSFLKSHLKSKTLIFLLCAFTEKSNKIVVHPSTLNSYKRRVLSCLRQIWRLVG